MSWEWIYYENILEDSYKSPGVLNVWLLIFKFHTEQIVYIYIYIYTHNLKYVVSWVLLWHVPYYTNI